MILHNNRLDPRCQMLQNNLYTFFFYQNEFLIMNKVNVDYYIQAQQVAILWI